MKESYVRLGDVCEVQNGFAFDSKYFSSNEGEGMPLIRIRDILNGFSKTYYTSDYQEEFIVHNGDFLIGMDGDFNIGQWKSEDALLNQRVCRLIPSNRILPKFIYYYIPTALQEINNKTAYTTVKHLSSKQVKAILLPNLSLSEQKRIVDILDAEFEKIDRLRSNAELNLRHAKDIFQAALKAELEPKDGWCVVELKDISEICLGLTHTPKYVEGDGVPFVSVKDISGGHLDLSSTKLISREEFATFPYGAKPLRNDVLFCRVGTIGYPLILESDEPFGIFVSVGFLRPNTALVSSPYLRYWMLSPMFHKQVDDNVVGSTLKNLNTGWLKHFSVPLPPIEVQPQIIERIQSLEQRCKVLQDNYSKTVALCDDLKQALLRKAINGDLSA